MAQDPEMTNLISAYNCLQPNFLEKVAHSIAFKSDIQKYCFLYRYNPQYQTATLNQIATLIKQQLQGEFQKTESINVIATRVAKKLTEKFREEMQNDGVAVDFILPAQGNREAERGRPKKDEESPYKLTYKWLWEQKFVRVGWKLALEIACPALEQMKMVSVEDSIRQLDLEEIPNNDSNCLQLGRRYQLQVILPNRGKNLLLINQDEAEKRFLICPSKAYAEIPYTLLSEVLYLPPGDSQPGRAKSIRFLSEGEEYFLAIVTELPLKLSWLNWESSARDIELDQIRLEEILTQVGKQSNSQVFYQRFKVV